MVVMSPRPGRVLDVVPCDLPGDERALEVRETPVFLHIAQRVREGLRAVAIDGLPRCGPFKLHHGPAAMAQAAAAMAAALDGAA